MTLNDLIRKANAVAGQFSSGDLELRLIDAITADSHGRLIKDIVFDPYAENGQYKINVIIKDMKDHLSDMTNETIFLPRCKGKKSSQRFQAIIRCADQMSEDRLIYLCFHASDDEFAEEMEKYGCKVVHIKSK